MDREGYVSSARYDERSTPRDRGPLNTGGFLTCLRVGNRIDLASCELILRHCLAQQLCRFGALTSRPIDRGLRNRNIDDLGTDELTSFLSVHDLTPALRSADPLSCKKPRRTTPPGLLDYLKTVLCSTLVFPI